jgi:hypothetical protein
MRGSRGGGGGGGAVRDARGGYFTGSGRGRAGSGGAGQGRGGHGFGGDDDDSAAAPPFHGIAHRPSPVTAAPPADSAARRNVKPLYRTGGVEKAEAAKGELYEIEAKGLIQRLRKFGDSAATASNAGSPTALSDDERRRLAELCLGMLARFPRHAVRVGAVAIIWAGFQSRLKATETAAHQALKDFDAWGIDDLFAAAPNVVASPTGGETGVCVAWRNWLEAKRAFDAVVRDASTRLSSILDGLRKFANTTDGRRLACRAHLCLGDLKRYEDRLAANAYTVAQRLAADIAEADQQAAATAKKKKKAFAAVTDFSVIAGSYFQLPLRSDHFVLHRLQRSWEEYEVARQLYPEHGQVHNSLALVYDTGRADVVQATSAYVRAIVAPEKPFVHALDSLRSLEERARPHLLLEDDLRRLQVEKDEPTDDASEDPSVAASDNVAAPTAAAAPSALRAYADFGAAFVTLVTTAARGERISAFVGGPLLVTVVRRLIAARQTAPAERLYTRVALACVLADFIGESIARKAQHQQRSGTVPELSNRSPTTTANESPQARGQAAEALFRGLVAALLELPRYLALEALQSTDVASALTILVAAWSGAPKLNGTLLTPTELSHTRSPKGLVIPATAAVPSLPQVVLTDEQRRQIDALLKSWSECAEVNLADVTSVCAKSDFTLGEAGELGAGAVAPEDAECEGLLDSVGKTIAVRLTAARASLKAAILLDAGADEDSDSDESEAAATGALGGQANNTNNDYRRARHRGHSAPLLSGSELIRLRLIRLHAVLHPAFLCPAGFVAPAETSPIFSTPTAADAAPAKMPNSPMVATPSAATATGSDGSNNNHRWYSPAATESPSGWSPLLATQSPFTYVAPYIPHTQFNFLTTPPADFATADFGAGLRQTSSTHASLAEQRSSGIVDDDEDHEGDEVLQPTAAADWFT